MIYMLDTNVIIKLMRGRLSDPVAQRVEQHIASDLCISAITLGELEYGCMKSNDPEKNRLVLYQILSGIHVLDFDAAAAIDFGVIFADLERRGMRIGDRDMQIAAHARSKLYTLVTHNTREFARIPDLLLEDWQTE